jgi:hypothetical protein
MNSSRVAYQARGGTTSAVVVDGKEGKLYDGVVIGSLVFSPDSRRLAYIAKLGDRYSLVVNEREGKIYEKVFDNPIFSPDSKRVAYVADNGTSQAVVVEGSEGNYYDGIWTDDDKKKGSFSFDAQGAVHYLAFRENRVGMRGSGVTNICADIYLLDGY